MAEQRGNLRKDFYYPGCADLSLDMQTRIGYAYANTSKGISVPIFSADPNFRLESLTTATTINIHAEIPVSQEFVTILSILERADKGVLITKASSLYNYFLGHALTEFENGTFALIWLPNGDMGIGIDLHSMNNNNTSEERECETIRNFAKNAKILFSIGVDNGR